MRFPYGSTITVIRGGTDRHGDPTPGVEHQIADVAIQPRSATPSDETTDRATTVVTGYTLLIPPDADIRATDRVRLPDDPPGTAPWQVDGEAGQYRSPFTGWTPGGVVAITRATG